MPACIRQYRIAAGNPDHYSGFMQFFLCQLVEERIDESRPAPTCCRAIPVQYGARLLLGFESNLRHGGY